MSDSDVAAAAPCISHSGLATAWSAPGTLSCSVTNRGSSAGAGAPATGTDTRPNRTLNPLRQAARYDPDGTYVRTWLPDLADLDGATIHRPWRADIPHSVYPPPLLDVPGM